ncbi:MAG: type II CRISPR RNA-guided endonuclease Cas9 [Planctomycetes bacterium]|nr:type II CRISPR RNA-guided endonuclease Cas9 [Planctomycetota bacterium]
MCARRDAVRPYVLGIDLGANSVGWACLAVDAEGEPVGLLHPPGDMAEHPSLGVRIFEIGVEHYGQGEREETRGKKRRLARLQRRQTMRRARRIRRTFNILQAAGLLPSFAPGAIASAGGHELARDQVLKALDRSISGDLVASGAAELRVAHELLPYVLRAQGLDRPLTRFELGRAFYHLAQRRGFLSNRKAGGKDDDVGAVKKGISELGKQIAARGSRSLGEHLLHLGREGARIRERWTSRKMYSDEFDALWAVQAQHRPDVLDEAFRKRLRRAVFFQRPLKNQSDRIGLCDLENGGQFVDLVTGVVEATKRRKRAPECLLVSQRFRLVQKVNDLALVTGPGTTAPLTSEQRSLLLDALECEDSLTFAEIRKRLGIKNRVKFNLEAGGEKRLLGNRTNAGLVAVFRERWTQLAQEERDAVVLEIWGASDDAALRKRVADRRGVWSRLGASKSEADEVADLTVSSEYMSLSRRAMQRLLPRMEAGEPYITARRAVYGEPVSAEIAEFLPSVKAAFGDLRNPVVTRALTELRRVVNTLIKQYGKPVEMRVELARDLKRGKDERNRMEKRMRENEVERQKAAKRIADEAGIPSTTGGDILKLRLAEECGWTCPYSGRAFGMNQLFEGEIDIEHILPLSRCLDDSYLNKTLCFSDVNRSEKRNRTPHEAFGAAGEPWDAMVQRMTRAVTEQGMSPVKLQRFQLAGEALEEHLTAFKSSQLNDTRHASVRAKEYLARLFGGCLATGVDADQRRRVVVGNGQATAAMRDAIRLDSVFPGGRAAKREDHRHHAVDAVAIALTGPATIQRLSSNVDTSRGRPRLGRLAPPWPSFDADVRNAFERIVVSFRVDNRVRGPLHAETLYSAPRDDRGSRSQDGGFVHIRRRLEVLSPKEVDDIVDERVRQLVVTALGGRPPEEVFLPSTPSSYPVLPNAHGAPMPIRRVRIRKAGSVRSIGAAHRERFVQNDENHHIEIRAARDAKGREKWDGRVVSLAAAAERRRLGRDVVDRGPDSVCSLAKNDVVEVDLAEGGRERLVVRGFSEFHTGQVQLTFSRNCDARQVSKVPRGGRVAGPDVLRQRNCRKLQVTPIGVLRPCRA